VRKQRRLSKASSENAKLIFVAETRADARKNLPRSGAKSKDARMAAIEK